MTRLPLTLAALTLAASGAALAAPPLAPLDAAKTLQVTETISQAPSSGPIRPVAILNITMSRPGLLRLEQTSPGQTATPGQVEISDGKTLTEYNPAQKQYRRQDAPSGLTMHNLPALAAFSPTLKPTKTVLNGKPMSLYTVSQAAGGGRLATKLWIDPATGLPVRQSTLLTQAGKTREVQRVIFSHWALNKPVDSAVFAFNPPAGATEYVEPKLLAAGTAAPDFTVQDPAGKPVKLSDYAGKVVVLDFWATWCGPCQASLPHTNQVARQFQGKNVVVLAVNVADSKDAFDKWLPQHKDYDAITFAIDTTKDPSQDVATRLYNVTGIPTQYIIDPAGKVAKSFVGFSGPTDDLANAITAALQTPAAPAAPAPAAG